MRGPGDEGTAHIPGYYPNMLDRMGRALNSPDRQPYTAWIEVEEFLNSWYNAPGEREARFHMTAGGRIMLGGAIRAGWWNRTAFTLPVGYRPDETCVFSVAAVEQTQTLTARPRWRAAPPPPVADRPRGLGDPVLQLVSLPPEGIPEHPGWSMVWLDNTGRIMLEGSVIKSEEQLEEFPGSGTLESDLNPDAVAMPLADGWIFGGFEHGVSVQKNGGYTDDETFTTLRFQGLQSGGAVWFYLGLPYASYSGGEGTAFASAAANGSTVSGNGDNEGTDWVIPDVSNIPLDATGQDMPMVSGHVGCAALDWSLWFPADPSGPYLARELGGPGIAQAEAGGGGMQFGYVLDPDTPPPPPPVRKKPVYPVLLQVDPDGTVTPLARETDADDDDRNVVFLDGVVFRGGAEDPADEDDSGIYGYE